MEKTKNYKYAKTLAIKWKNSKKTIMDKLTKKGVNYSEATKIIKKLEDENILSDKKAFDIELFILENKRYGYKRIKDTLILKGFPSEYTDTYIFNKDIEMDNCFYYFFKGVKKYPTYKYFSNEREKLINYLKRYGFNGKIISDVLKVGIDYENVS